MYGADWIRMATEIELNYSFDAFVILHGTEKVTLFTHRLY
jgi:60kDa lysophospholipase